MSGDSEAPPTYYFNGITFNPDFYQSTSGDLVSINAGANTTGNNYVFSHSGCFTLTSSSYVYLEFWLRGQSGATQTYNLSGCIYRIA